MSVLQMYVCMYVWDGLLCQEAEGNILFFVCFQIVQFNEKLKDQTGNPWQQPRNPRFMMLSMLHCKQIQAAYQGGKHVERSIKLRKVIALENTDVFHPYLYRTTDHLKPNEINGVIFCPLKWKRGMLTLVIFFSHSDRIRAVVWYFPPLSGTLL